MGDGQRLVQRDRGVHGEQGGGVLGGVVEGAGVDGAYMFKPPTVDPSRKISMPIWDKIPSFTARGANRGQRDSCRISVTFTTRVWAAIASRQGPSPTRTGAGRLSLTRGSVAAAVSMPSRRVRETPTLLCAGDAGAGHPDEHVKGFRDVGRRLQRFRRFSHDRGEVEMYRLDRLGLLWWRDTAVDLTHHGHSPPCVAATVAVHRWRTVWSPLASPHLVGFRPGRRQVLVGRRLVGGPLTELLHEFYASIGLGLTWHHDARRLCAKLDLGPAVADLTIISKAPIQQGG